MKNHETGHLGLLVLLQLYYTVQFCCVCSTAEESLNELLLLQLDSRDRLKLHVYGLSGHPHGEMVYFLVSDCPGLS